MVKNHLTLQFKQMEILHGEALKTNYIFLISYIYEKNPAFNVGACQPS